MQVKKRLLIFCLIGVVVFFISCKKDVKEKVNPFIKFEVEEGYISSDTILDLDQTVKIKITATSDESAITLFNFKIYDGESVVSVDSGLNCNSFTTVISLTKGFSTQEKWVFSVRNKDLRWDSVWVNVGLNPGWQFGPITHISGIQLGAQQNASIGSFYSLSQNSVYTFSNAQNSQNFVDLCYYYDNAGDLNSLASPGANIATSIFDFSSWSIRNEARFVQTSLSVSDFDNCQNDSLIISNTFVYQSGKRKCKLLTPGNVYSFIRGEYKGLIKFTQVEGAETGTMTMDIKYQNL